MGPGVEVPGGSALAVWKDWKRKKKKIAFPKLSVIYGQEWFACKIHIELCTDMPYCVCAMNGAAMELLPQIICVYALLVLLK